MKNIKNLLYAAAAVLLLPLTSCSDDDYPLVPEPTGQEVYFSATLATSYTLSRDASTVEIPVMRVKTEEAETIQLMFEDESGLFTIPNSVTFAAGASSAKIVISYNFEDLTPSTTYPISLLVMGNQSEWGQSQVQVKLVVAAPWIKLGTGLFRDDIVASAYNGIEPSDHEVAIYEYDGRPGYYYLESPYNAQLLGEWFDMDPSQLGNNVQAVQFIIDATDPDAVVIGSPSNPQPLGCILGEDGWLYTYSEMPGTLVDGVITFPQEGLMIMFSETPGAYKVNSNSMFRVVLPGVTIVDCSISAAYDGMKIAADGTSSALFNLSFGADVASYKYVIAEGDVTSDRDTVVAGIVDGSLENIAEGDVDHTTIAVALDASGMCSFVAVPYDADGEAKTGDAIIVPFFFPGQGGGTIPDIECALELNTIAYYYGEAFEAQFPATTFLAFKVTATDVKNVIYYINKTATIEGSGMEYKDILSTYGINDGEKGGSMTADLNAEGEYIGYFSGREPGTSYTLLMEIESIYGKKYVISATRSTASVDYKGELVLGSYYMTYTSSFVSENTFTLQGTDDPAKFIILDLGIDGPGVRWHAVYDSAASTLTCDGTVVGNESKGCMFGYLLGYANAAQTQGWGIFAYDDMTSDAIDDPVVFKVDPATKQIVELNTYIEVFVANASDGSVLGDVNLFYPGTKVELVPATSSVRAKALDFASQFNNLQNAGVQRALKGSKMVDTTVACASLNEPRQLRTIATKAEPCARAKKSSFKAAVRF